MKQFLSILSLCAFLGVGCTSIPDLPSDFEPVQGKATPVHNEDPTKEGPYHRRLMTAISYDGLSYVQTGTWISDQANVPDAVVTENGTIYAYYTGWIVGEYLNTTAVAISNDQGRTWSYKYIQLEDAPSISKPVDPDVVLLEDGTFRMYFTTTLLGGNIGIHYAESTDGTRFVYKGSAWTPRNNGALDSTTVKIGDTWHMWTLSQDGIDKIYHLTSTNGIDFEFYGLTSFPINDLPHMPSNGVWVDDRFHLFLFGPSGDSLVSMWTKNGYDWYPDEGTRLDPYDEEEYVKDPTIVPVGDDQYLMIYVTNTP